MIVVGDVWAFALEQSLFGQQVVNTFALKVTSTPGSVSENVFMANAWANVDSYFNRPGGLRESIQALQSEEVSTRAWRVKRVAGALTNEFVFNIAADEGGARPPTCDTANTAMSIQRKGLAPGRRSRGRIAIAGIPALEIVGGRFTLNILTDANAVAAELVGQGQTSDLTAFQLGYWTAHKEVVRDGENIIYPAQFTHCITATPQATVRVQRSRTVDRGS